MFQHMGGSFAPPLTDDKLASYMKLAETAPREIADAMLTLLNCAEKWWNLPESTGGGKPHPSGRGQIVPLDATIAKKLWDHIPWKRELDSMEPLFEAIDPSKDKPLRDACFHLLWHARELDLDREPITNDKI